MLLFKASHIYWAEAGECPNFKASLTILPSRAPQYCFGLGLASNLCHCRVGVLAAGGGSDAVSLKDLLSMLQYSLIAELQVELETDTKDIYKNLKLFFKSENLHCNHSTWFSSFDVNYI